MSFAWNLLFGTLNPPILPAKQNAVHRIKWQSHCNIVPTQMYLVCNNNSQQILIQQQHNTKKRPDPRIFEFLEIG
jgi:hypothetical protein